MLRGQTPAGRSSVGHRGQGAVCQHLSGSLSPLPSPLHRTSPTSILHSAGSIQSIHSNRSSLAAASSEERSIEGHRHVNGQRGRHGIRASSMSGANRTAVMEAPEKGALESNSCARQQDLVESSGVAGRIAENAAGGLREHSASMAHESPSSSSSTPSSSGHTNPSSGGPSNSTGGFAYAPAERSQIRETWATLMRWSKRTRQQENINPLESTSKVSMYAVRMGSESLA